MQLYRLVFVSCLCLSISVAAIASEKDDSSMSTLPLTVQSSISAAVGRDSESYQAKVGSTGFIAANARQNLSTNFTAKGVEVRIGDAI